MKYGISIVTGIAYGKSAEHFIHLGVGAKILEDIKRFLDTIKTDF